MQLSHRLCVYLPINRRKHYYICLLQVLSNFPFPFLIDQDGLQEGEPHVLTESSKDELFGQFFAALEKIHFFKRTSDGNDDMVQLEKVTRLFHNAINVCCTDLSWEFMVALNSVNVNSICIELF